MKQQIRYYSFLLVILVFCGCVREQDLENNNIREVYASFENDDTRVALEQRASSLSLIAKWQSDDRIKVFLQDNRRYSELPSVPVRDMSSEGMDCMFRYGFPDDFHSRSGYKEVCFTETCGAIADNSIIYFNASLVRVPIQDYKARVFSSQEVVDGRSIAVFKHYLAYELLHVSNTTEQDISFSLNGYNATVTWFKREGAICYDTGEFSYTFPATQPSIEKSESVTIKPGEVATIVSAYVPNGNRIIEARICAEINGNIVYSANTLSSNSVLKAGHAYHMYVTWDGTSLSFKDGNSQATIITGEAKEIQSNCAKIPVSIESHNTVLGCGVVYSATNPDPVIGGDDCMKVESESSNNEFEVILKNLLGITKYYARGYANIGTNGSNSYAYGNVVEFSTLACELATEPTEGELIDLGLSVLWASCNVGASLPQDVGHFFAWGELEPKTVYDWSNYTHSSGTANSLKKYCTDPKYGTVDNKTTLEFADDAAYSSSQGKMRIPTTKECQELYDNCKRSRITYKEQIGYLFASPKTGKAIFIPCNGLKYNSLWVNHDSAYYWTSDLSSEADIYADHFGGQTLMNWNRQEGLSIRPVSDKTDDVTIDVNPTRLEFGKVPIGSSATKVVIVSNTGSGALTFRLEGADDRFSWTPTSEVTLESGKSCEVTITFAPSSTGQVGSTLRVFSNATNGTKYIECTGEGVESTIAVPEIVDLGLSVKWASFNLGATKPEESGDFYAWGETAPYYSSQDPLIWKEGKEAGYDWPSYTWCMGDENSITKYNATDGKTVLDPEDDAAHVNLGGKWRMPTGEEWGALFNNCTSIWTKENGVRGMRLTSKVPGYTDKSIFLPAAGSRARTVRYSYFGTYWSSSLMSDDSPNPDESWQILFDDAFRMTTNGSRYVGCSVRPVYDDPDAKPVIKKPEPIDLGLPSGLKWASFNLGAISPEDYGGYYAWGETEPYYSSLYPLTWKPGKEAGYDWPSYTWCIDNDNSITITKYCTNSSWGYYGFTDNKTVLDLEDDAAHVNLGGKWRMPTDADWTELMNNCTWTWTTQNGVNGSLVTGSNGNSIFLPAAGSGIYTDLYYAGSEGEYWSSSLNTGHSNSAWYAIFNSDDIRRHSHSRIYGRSIRPVTE